MARKSEPLGEPLLVGVSAASRLLGVSAYTIRRLVRRGELGCKRIASTKWLISMASIKRFADVKAA
jgi:excisionase family DNA binding protein